MEHILLSCGHAANAIDGNGNPSCAICVGIHDTSPVTGPAPDLLIRKARCSCGAIRPSGLNLPFFEYRGPGSRYATDMCRNCSFSAIAHSPETMARNNNLKCTSFEPRSDGHEYDSYYCGHGGWD